MKTRFQLPPSAFAFIPLAFVLGALSMFSLAQYHPQLVVPPQKMGLTDNAIQALVALYQGQHKQVLDFSNEENVIEAEPPAPSDYSAMEFPLQENQNHVFYEIPVPHNQGSTVQSEIDGSSIILSGVTREPGDIMAISSEFSYAFPIPEGTDAAKLDIVSGVDRIVVVFPKVNPSLND